MLHEVKALHLTPSLVVGGTRGLALGQGICSTSGPFGLSPFQVLLVRLEKLIRSSLRELADVIKRKLGHDATSISSVVAENEMISCRSWPIDRRRCT
jgi:hypothetical protein